ANALRASLETADGENPLTVFELLESNLKHQYVNKAAARYASGSLVTVIILVSLSWLVYNFGPEGIKLIALGSMGGAAGSLISVIARIRNIEANASPLWYWSAEGSFRTLLG